MSEIEEYIKNPASYDYGIELLKKYNPEHHLMDIIAKSNNSFTRSKLIEALQAIEVEVKPKPLQKRRYSSEDIAKWPPEIEGLHDKIKSAYASMNHYQSAIRIEVYGANALIKKRYSQKKVHGYAQEVINHDQFIRQAWAIIDNYVDTGFIPEHLKEKDELSKLRWWLKVIIPYTNWVIKHRDKVGTENYEHRKTILREIQLYNELHR